MQNKSGKVPQHPSLQDPLGGGLGRRTGVDGKRMEQRRSRQEKAAGSFLGLELHSGRWAGAAWARGQAVMCLGASHICVHRALCKPWVRHASRKPSSGVGGEPASRDVVGEPEPTSSFQFWLVFLSQFPSPASPLSTQHPPVMLCFSNRLSVAGTDFSPFRSTHAGEKLARSVPPACVPVAWQS